MHCRIIIFQFLYYLVVYSKIKMQVLKATAYNSTSVLKKNELEYALIDGNGIVVVTNKLKFEHFEPNFY